MWLTGKTIFCTGFRIKFQSWISVDPVDVTPSHHHWCFLYAVAVKCNLQPWCLVTKSETDQPMFTVLIYVSRSVLHTFQVMSVGLNPLNQPYKRKKISYNTSAYREASKLNINYCVRNMVAGLLAFLCRAWCSSVSAVSTPGIHVPCSWILWVLWRAKCGKAFIPDRLLDAHR